MLGINVSTLEDVTYLPLGNESGGNQHRTLWFGGNVDIAHCDFVFYRRVVDSSASGGYRDFAFAVNMSNYGARLYDMLQVMGIGVDFASLDNVDITRLFAYYMAYYGSFGLSLYTNYESSNCNRFLKAYENGGNGFRPVGLGADNTTPRVFGDVYYLNEYFVNFITDLCTGYVT